MDKVIVGICIAATLGVVGLVVRNAQSDPFDARETALEQRLATIRPKQIEYKTNTDVDYLAMMSRVADKPSLWDELIPPPPPPPPKPPKIKPPNLRKMLDGVVPSLRQSVGSGENEKPLFRTKQNKRGEFMGVGEKINGVTILRVTDTHVLFGLEKDGREYSIELERR